MLLTSWEAYAGCDDPPAPRVDWWHCEFDGRDMPGADFTESMMRAVSISGADLSKTIFVNADVKRANFFGSDLRGADFTNAKLREADFTKADLKGAKFIASDLRHARLQSTKLYGANFTAANIEEADFYKADLTGAIWLDGVKVCKKGSLGECK